MLCYRNLSTVLILMHNSDKLLKKSWPKEEHQYINVSFSVLKDLLCEATNTAKFKCAAKFSDLEILYCHTINEE